jgi:hypothetical protein
VTSTADVSFEGVEGFEGVDRALETAPAVVYFWMREAYKRMNIDHRRSMLAVSKIKLNRKPKAGRRPPIEAPKVDDKRNLDPETGIRWVTEPEDKRRPNAKSADLLELGLDILTRNNVLVAFEAGTTIRPRRGRMLAVPIKAPGSARRGRRTPYGFRQAKPKAVLIARKSKRSGTLLLFERKRKRSGERQRLQLNRRGEVRSRQRKTIRDTLVPRWALLPSVNLRRALGFYSTWDKQAQLRAKRLAFAADRILRDIAKGVKD